MSPKKVGARARFAGAALALGLLASLAASPAQAALPDGRGWEMVSPVDKNGGQVDPPGTISGGGVLQAAATGGAVTYSSKASFGAGASGAPPASQYVSTRGTSGWSTENISPPILSGSYDIFEGGAPYQLFSPDLARALLLNGAHCRSAGSSCAVANPPLGGTDAPDGFQNYYLREAGAFEALVGEEDVLGRELDSTTFDVLLAGGSPDLRTVVLSSCSRLTGDAVDGCGLGKANLYRWSQASGSLTLINTLPGAQLAAQAGAVSADGSRTYWRDLNTGALFLREGTTNSPVDAAAGGGGTFETASADGSVAFFTKAGHLWRYASGIATDLTPGGGVEGVLGASADGSAVYYQDASGLRRWAGTASTVADGAAAAAPDTYPPATGRARVSADGSKLLFVSTESLTGYDNTDKVTGEPDSEVFLYDAGSEDLICVSCNPQGKRPIGPSTIPGVFANGTAPGSLQVYKPRVLSANGRRVFFDSEDAVTVADSNSNPTTGAGIADVYEWEAQGEGGCTTVGGCAFVLSNGAAPDGASFIDASADGNDAYFITDTSLVPTDPGSGDLYDARVGGGFPVPPPPIPCEGDACQILPSAPLDPSLATLESGVGNPAVTYRKYCRKGYVKRKGICVKKGSNHRKHRKHRRHGGKR